MAVSRTSGANPGGLVITGATGGIGRAIAATAFDRGYTLFLQGNHRLAELDPWLKKVGTDRIETFAANLSEPSNQLALTSAVCKGLRKRRIPFAGWIHAAGVDLSALSRNGKTFDERLQAIMAVDVESTVRISREMVRQLRADNIKKPGRSLPLFLFFSWDGVQRGQEGENSQLYAIAKGAVSAFARSFIQDSADQCRVNTIAPGWIQTTWGKTAPEPFQRRAVQDSLAGRWGTPDDVAALALFLLDPKSAFLNGQEIPLNGGFNMVRT